MKKSGNEGLQSHAKTDLIYNTSKSWIIKWDTLSKPHKSIPKESSWQLNLPRDP